jgi:hypothetical protein
MLYDVRNKGITSTTAASRTRRRTRSFNGHPRARRKAIRRTSRRSRRTLKGGRSARPTRSSACPKIIRSQRKARLPTSTSRFRPASPRTSGSKRWSSAARVGKRLPVQIQIRRKHDQRLSTAVLLVCDTFLIYRSLH